jgi:hypothetical protein
MEGRRASLKRCPPFFYPAIERNLTLGAAALAKKKAHRVSDGPTGNSGLVLRRKRRNAEARESIRAGDISVLASYLCSSAEFEMA